MLTSFAQSIGITSTVSPFSLFFSLKLRFNQTLPMRAVAFLLLLLCATCHIALSFTDGKWHFPGLPPLLLLLLLLLLLESWWCLCSNVFILRWICLTNFILRLRLTVICTLCIGTRLGSMLAVAGSAATS